MANPAADGHGDVFASGHGAMIVHVQRENGLAHRTFVLRPWQVRLFRAASHRGVRLLAALVVLSWGYFAFEAARVPLLTTRLARMESDALRLDTLEQTLKQLQARYEQVQAMLSAPQTQKAAVPQPATGNSGSRPETADVPPRPR
jgi:hypothetical protein